MNNKSLKSFALFTAFAMILSFCMIFTTGCSDSRSDDTIILRVCNWEDYIWVDDEDETDYDDMCDKFEKYMESKGKKVAVEYSTFGTNENLYNDLKIAGGYIYDVVCPSDYMIEKMAREGILEKFTDIDPDFLENSDYTKNVSPYINKIFTEDITWVDDSGESSLADYAAGYMWGTLGYVYNPGAVEGITEDMLDWTSIWDAKYRHRVTIKDSVRDSYFIGIAYAFKDELESLKEDLDLGNISSEEYIDELTEIFNRTDEESVAKVEECLSVLKDNLFGFEVDSGKNDMVTGKIYVNFAWSGDAVYAMDEAQYDENGEERENAVYLYYSVPEQGSNIWFDGWCIPKNAQQKEIALEFINFLSEPENAIANMEYIGYTTSIAGENDEILDWLLDDYYYSEEDEEPGGSGYGLLEEETEGYYAADLSYFFHNEAVVYTEEIGRQFSTQFPTEDIISRCVFMHYFDDETNERINLMWENVKGFALPVWAIILIIAAILLAVAAFIVFKFREKLFKNKKNYAAKAQSKTKKELKVVERKDLY